MNKRIFFFGTGEFGAAMLSAIFNKGYVVDLVITQPDRPVGRNREITETAVKKLAKSLSLKIDQPETLKNYQLPDQKPDLIIVCQYGLIIPQRILDYSKSGAINVHTSLLPKYRGASPIQSAIVNGEKETGVTIMLMDAQMDHGNILKQRPIDISADEKYPDLEKKLVGLAAALLIETLSGWLDGTIEPTAQNDAEATYCKIFTRDDGKIDWNKTNQQIYNLFRGLYPWPGIWTIWNKKRLKILDLELSDMNLPASLIKIENKEAYIGCGKGSVKLKTLQLEGKKPQSIKDFITGYSNFDGSKFE